MSEAFAQLIAIGPFAVGAVIALAGSWLWWSYGPGAMKRRKKARARKSG
jgi:uncharacterized membrane protein YdfJ with MMPL/SSD domain